MELFKCPVKPRESKENKRIKEEVIHGKYKKTASKVIDFNPNILIITLNMNGLKVQVKRKSQIQ